MLVDALALLLGERASSDVVRPGAQKTVIEGAFDFSSIALHRLAPSFTALGVEPDDGRLILKREISGEGRSRAWVNGSPTTVSVLAQLGALLVDLHGQHETQSLLRPDAQRDMIDAYADAAVERTAVRDAHERLRAVEQRRDVLFRLTQKYGPTLPDVLATRDRTTRELELLDTADLDLRHIAAERGTRAADFTRACTALTAKRSGGAERLADAVNALLPALGMP